MALTLSAANIPAILNQMLAAAEPSLTNGGMTATDTATRVFTAYLNDLDDVNQQVTSGELTAAQGQQAIAQFKISMQIGLNEAEGLGEVAAQNAINAALTTLNAVISATLSAGLKVI